MIPASFLPLCRVFFFLLPASEGGAFRPWMDEPELQECVRLSRLWGGRRFDLREEAAPKLFRQHLVIVPLINGFNSGAPKPKRSKSVSPAAACSGRGAVLQAFPGPIRDLKLRYCHMFCWAQHFKGKLKSYNC